MLNMCNTFIILCLTLFCSSYALSVHGSKTLIVYDERLIQRDEFSSLFDSLEERSYELHFFPLGNETSLIELNDGESRLYDNLMIFPSKGKNLNRRLSVTNLLNFYDNGGDIFAVTTPDAIAEPVRLFLNELGIYPSPKDHVLIDYFQDFSSTLKVSAKNSKNQFMSDSNTEDFLVFENASVALIDNRAQIIPIITAPSTSFTSGKGKETWTSGSQGFLAAGFQSLSNARVGWVGSTAFLNNQNQKYNGKFIQSLLKWNFQERGVIRISESSHSHADGTPYEALPYKIKDPVKYEIGISEWDGEKWVPFLTTDLQFELKMIDPYYRLPLIPSKEDGAVQYYTTSNFSLPDHHGVFTFQVDYKRPGFSFISASDVKAIRHLAHDEYSRSWEITNSRVYLTTIFALIFVWILFVIFFFSTSAIDTSMAGEKKTI